MKIQFTAEEIAQALKEYCHIYKSLRLSNITLAVALNIYGDDPDQDDFWATADFEIIP